jgi:ABC-type transport system substrate-binding protein
LLYKYDPEKAKALLKEAGCPDTRPVQRPDPPCVDGGMGPQRQQLGHYGNPDVYKMVEQIFSEFDVVKRLALLTKLNEMMNEEQR